jgi:hypothetical protein
MAPMPQWDFPHTKVEQALRTVTNRCFAQPRKIRIQRIIANTLGVIANTFGVIVNTLGAINNTLGVIWNKAGLL